MLTVNLVSATVHSIFLPPTTDTTCTAQLTWLSHTHEHTPHRCRECWNQSPY